MKIKYFFAFVLLLGSTSYGQIVAVTGTAGGGSCIAPSGTSTCNLPTSPTLNIDVGDTVVLAMGNNSALSAPTPGGTCNQAWGTPVVNNTTTPMMRIWIVAHAATAVTSCQVAISGLSSGASAFVVQVYKNVQSIGTPVLNTNATNNATTLSAPTISAAQAGNFILGFMFTNSAGGPPYTGIPPTTYRRGGGSSTATAGVAFGDVTATSAGQQVTVQLAPNSGLNYRSTAIELMGISNHTAQAAEAMHTVLMSTPRDNNYILPASGLSPTWCSWFMPTGANSHTYELEPETTRQLNGQNNPIRIPSWQMTRICQDDNGSFWASPPLHAGAGISITGSATGVEISTSGAGGDMAYIAGGTSHIPTGAIAANDCSTLLTTTSSSTPSAAGILPTDVISWSMQTGAATTGFAQVTLRTIPGTDQIQWRFCNAGTTSYSPAARDINWYVARRTVSPVAARHKPATHKPARTKK